MARISHLAAAGKRVVAARQTTGSIAGAGTASVVVTLPRAHASTDYTATASVEDSSGDLSLRSVLARTTTTVTVQVRNNNTLTARTGTVHVLTISD